jgi:hypothetical protein
MIAGMTLPEYIASIGDAKAARLFRVKIRTVAAWRRKERTPRKEHAAIIVAKSPITYAGIYGL